MEADRQPRHSDNRGDRKPKPSLLARIFRYFEQERRRANTAREIQEREHRQNERLIAQWSRRVGIFTAALALVTAISVIIAAIQVWAFIESERASAVVVSVTNNLPFVDGQKVSLRILLRNSGKSDAIVTDGNFSTQYGTGDLDPTPKYRAGKAFRIIITAGDTFTTYSTTNHPLINGAAEALQTGKFKYWAYGYVELRDRFSWLLGPIITGFCAIYNPERDPTKGDPTFQSCGPDKAAYIFSR